MSNYIQVEFKNIHQLQSEILIAELAESGYEGFEEEEGSLKAFIPENIFDEQLLNNIASAGNISYAKKLIKEANWNKVWESNFQPVFVDDFVAIRADFHEPISSTQFEIVITPKMSFGTGHHATTYMMIQQMRSIDFQNKSVFDFGTGTGVLAILAEKLGAKKLTAADNDEWSITNAAENIKRNSCSNIDLLLSSEVPADRQFDIILTNINKNVILANIRTLKQQLKKDGSLLLSGLLNEDESDILSATDKSGLKLISKMEQNSWISLRLSN
jgi:ribosomal protein L11 methyltransferase